MTTRMSSKGQVVIPAEVRRRLGLSRDSDFRVEVENDHVVLIPVRRKSWRELPGSFADLGVDLLEDLEREHREEIERGR